MTDVITETGIPRAQSSKNRNKNGILKVCRENHGFIGGPGTLETAGKTHRQETWTFFLDLRGGVFSHVIGNTFSQRWLLGLL